MRIPIQILLSISIICQGLWLFSQTPAVVISSYFNAADPRDEWTELLVVADNTNMYNWILQDNNSTQTTWQPAITLSNPGLWNNMRAGTVIIIWHRMIASSGMVHPVDASKADGYIEVSANDPTYFSGGSFGTSPLYSGPTLNIAPMGDLLVLKNASSTFVHALGHAATTGSSWTPLALPKLNYQGSITDGEAVYVCPGSILDEYGNIPPQDGTTWSSAGNALTFGLPNGCVAGTSSQYWRNLREPNVSPDTLTATINSIGTVVTLNWNAVPDPFPTDGAIGYMILRNSNFTTGNPIDGYTYPVGGNMQTDTVIALIASSQTLTYTDTVIVPCGWYYHYRIYSYRFNTDEIHGSGYNQARGRAYNEGTFGMAQAGYTFPIAPVTATTDRNNFCADDPGDITLTAIGGSGITLNWYTDSCGGSLVGTSAASNTLTIPSPAMTTTYFVCWETPCGISSCVSLSVNVLPVLPVSVSITADENPVCTGTPVIFTADAVNPGTAPIYQWKVNGLYAGTNNDVFTYTPSDGDSVNVVMTTDVNCPSINPVTSNSIAMVVSTTVPLTVSIMAYPNDTVCDGINVTYTASPNNGGTNPAFAWFLNGTPVGTNNQTWSNTPLDGDILWCRVTSNSLCVTNSPTNSDTMKMTVLAEVSVNLDMVANPGDTICAGTPVTFTATPANGGTLPFYQWYLNGNPTGVNNSVYIISPADGDSVFCVLTSNLACTLNNPATSATIKITYTPALNTTVNISADKDSVCPGSVVTFTAQPSNEGSAPLYEWLVDGVSAQHGGSAVFITNSLTGGELVICRMTSSMPCLVANPVESLPLAIFAATAPMIQLSDKPFLCAGDPTQLDAGQGFASYLWQDGSKSRYFTATDEGIYHVTVTDSNGCTASDSVLMKVCDALMLIPNAFTPNADGLNDVFRVVTSQEGIISFSMRIFNRWGEMIFESSDIHLGWNGMVKGQYAPVGSYVWEIVYQISTLTNPSAYSYSLRGTVKLIR